MRYTNPRLLYFTLQTDRQMPANAFIPSSVGAKIKNDLVTVVSKHFSHVQFYALDIEMV